EPEDRHAVVLVALDLVHVAAAGVVLGQPLVQLVAPDVAGERRRVGGVAGGGRRPPGRGGPPAGRAPRGAPQRRGRSRAAGGRRGGPAPPPYPSGGQSGWNPRGVGTDDSTAGRRGQTTDGESGAGCPRPSGRLRTRCTRPDRGAARRRPSRVRARVAVGRRR